MAINFTDSPADGATQVISGRTYTYNSAKNKWDTTATEVAGPTAAVYATVNDLPGSATTGDQAFVSGTNRLYIWNGSGWYNIALVNNTPTWTNQPNSSYALASDGTATTITIVAADPEGLPITYSIASDTSGNIATVTQGTGANVNTFTITPSTSTADAGTFSLTFRASDGVNVASAISSFTLKFTVENQNYTTALITTAGNSGANNSFTDSSGNSRTVSVTGDATQNSFSPYRHAGYSTYLATNTSYVRSPTSADFDIGGTGDWAYEAWVYVPSSHSFATYARAFGLGPFYNNSKSFGLTLSDGAHSNYITVYWDDASGLGRKLISSTTFDKGQWNHLLVARSGNSIGLFYNGTRIASNDSYTSAIDGGNTYLFVGHTGNGTEGAEEYIKSLRFINGSHPYDASASSITTPSEDLEEVTNTKILLGQKPYIVDESSNSHALTTSGTVKTEPFTPYDSQEYSAASHGGSVYFDGNGDYLAIDSTNTLDLDGNFTIEGWFRQDGSAATTNYPSIISSTTWNNSVSFSLRFNNTGNANKFQVAKYGYNNAGTNNIIVGSKTYPYDTWNHFALVRTGAIGNQTVTLYVNGENNGSASDNASYNLSYNNAGAKIGGGNWDGANSYIRGHLADLRVVKGTAVYTAEFTPPTAPLTAITNTSLLLNMQGAKILDKAQSVERLTLAGDTTASTAQYKYLPTSMYFDGTDDYITIPAGNRLTNFGTGDFTIEGWFYPTSTSWYIPWDFRSGSDTANMALFWSYTSGTYIFYQNSAFKITSSSTFSASQWHHVAVTRDSGTCTLWVNGTSEGTASITTDFTNDNLIWLGRYYQSNAYDFNGYISDFRITKGLARYTANFTPPTAALDG